MGKLKDISPTGAGFQYTQFEPEDKPLKAEPVEVDIFSDGMDFHLPYIPCGIVYDAQFCGNGDTPNSNVRRCGLSFGPPTKQQSTQLANLIGKYT